MTLLDTSCAPARIVGKDGTASSLNVEAWTAPADHVERRRLAHLPGPVLDIGCGPGRLVVALAELGIPAMGVDASPAAVDLAGRRDAAALVRSVFDQVPATGRWRSALLFDGNIGIGGDPGRLLARSRQLLARGGRLVVETGPPGRSLHQFQARIERGGTNTDWFPWATIGADSLVDLAGAFGFGHLETTADDARWFVELERST